MTQTHIKMSLTQIFNQIKGGSDLYTYFQMSFAPSQIYNYAINEAIAQIYVQIWLCPLECPIPNEAFTQISLNTYTNFVPNAFSNSFQLTTHMFIPF